tara:strand:- start:1322 stop:1561 length:240 start_codon:yes stop_codon:yes gene_type:complete
MKDNVTTQKNRILGYLQNGGKLTALNALQNFGCFRLASRIFDLKREGWAIKSEKIKLDGKSCSCYYISKGVSFNEDSFD